MIPPHILALIAVGALLAGPVSVMTRKAFWRALSEFHPAAVATVLFSLIVPTAAVALLRFRPGMAIVLSWGVIGVMSACAFLARRSRGGRAGRPPGSLGWWGSVLSLIDPAEYARRTTRHGDVFKIRQMHRAVVCVVDLAEGTRLFREYPEALGPATLPYNDRVPGGFVRYLRGEAHRERRSALRSAFSRRSVAGMEASLRASIRAGVRVLVDREPWHPNELEWPVLHAMVVAYLGPGASALLQDSTAGLVRALSNGKESDLRALMADLPREPSEPSIMASLVAMLSGEAGRSDEERSEKILGNAAYMLHLGWQDLSGLAAWLVVECARRPELLQAVRTDPDTAARVVDETLRLHQSEYLYRKANADIRVADFVIPKGWLIRLCVREAHRSEAHFREPDSFDAGRFEDGCPYGRPSPDRFQPFGVDHHRCIGNDLTYKIGRLLVEELAHYQLRVVREASDSVGTRHWRHVTPGRRMRLQLSSSPESNR